MFFIAFFTLITFIKNIKFALTFIYLRDWNMQILTLFICLATFTRQIKFTCLCFKFLLFLFLNFLFLVIFIIIVFILSLLFTIFNLVLFYLIETFCFQFFKKFRYFLLLYKLDLRNQRLIEILFLLIIFVVYFDQILF